MSELIADYEAANAGKQKEYDKIREEVKKYADYQIRERK